VSPRLSSAPVTWGVWEMTIDRDDLVAPEAMLEAVRELGYEGIELGPIGYFGDAPEAVAELLGAYGLELAGAFVELHLADGEAFERDLPMLEQTLAILATAGGPLVLADAGSPERRAASGQAGELTRTALGPEEFAAAMERLNGAVARSVAVGVTPTFHPHAATYVETMDEAERMLAATRPELGLCLDTGHSLIGGIDPAELAVEEADRLAHVHLKDVDREVRSRLAAGELDVDEAWEQGLFCPFGEGEADLPGFLALPEVRSFEGWVVIEQDRMRVRDTDLERVSAIERQNRERVLEWSGWR
jgi:inosose dehydratase